MQKNETVEEIECASTQLAFNYCCTWLHFIGQPDLALRFAEHINSANGHPPEAAPSGGGTPPPAPALGGAAVVELAATVQSSTMVMGHAQARQSGFTGDQCPTCSSMMMVRNGSCLKCEACGSTTGCS